MTHERDQIEFEGSRDGGATWRTYRYKWQPQALDRRPRFMAPHLPRFDWNLWFATLDDWHDHLFVLAAAGRLIENEPTVIALFDGNPFPDGPPDRVRFPTWRYRFTDWATWRATGAWWRRERVDDWAPMVYRDAGGSLRVAKE